jgi:hypothetical protein
VNDRKFRTGERVEVAIYGEPGAYVGLSGIDRAFYSMQAGNELTYASVNICECRKYWKYACQLSFECVKIFEYTFNII